MNLQIAVAVGLGVATLGALIYKHYTGGKKKILISNKEKADTPMPEEGDTSLDAMKARFAATNDRVVYPERKLNPEEMAEDIVEDNSAEVAKLEEENSVLSEFTKALSEGKEKDRKALEDQEEVITKLKKENAELASKANTPLAEEVEKLKASVSRVKEENISLRDEITSFLSDKAKLLKDINRLTALMLTTIDFVKKPKRAAIIEKLDKITNNATKKESMAYTIKPNILPQA